MNNSNSGIHYFALFIYLYFDLFSSGAVLGFLFCFVFCNPG